MNKKYIYGLGERIWHWTQALTTAVLLFTGFAIHLLIPGGMDFLDLYNWHSVVGFILIVNTFIGNVYFLSNHQVSQFIPYVNSKFLDDFIFQFKYYILGRFKGQSQPFKKTTNEKLNPLQKTTYFGMLFIVIPIQILSGVLLYFYKGFTHGIVELIGGFGVVSIAHVIMAFVFLSFLIIHLYLTFLAKPFYNYYLGMITGFELETDEEGEK